MNRFLGACGATGPLRVAAERPRVFGPVSVALEKPFALIGSGVNADLRLDDIQVSHRHLYLQVYNGRVFAIDLGSRTGTHWDKVQQPFGWLDLGQSLWVGKHRVYLEEDEPARKSVAEMPQEPLLSRDFQLPNLPPVSLEFVKGGIHKEGKLQPARCAVNRVMVLLGRTDGCKIRLMDHSVSKFHCSLIRTPRGVWVVDLLSRNGIWVNGTKVPWARLEQGDRLEVGQFVLRLRYDDADYEPAESEKRPRSPVGPGEQPPGHPGSDSEKPARSETIAAGDRKPSQESPIKASEVGNWRNTAGSKPVVVEHEAAENQGHALVVSPNRGMIPVELSESIAVIIANQFSQMQQQMFDQFHQAMMVMFQTFSTLHRDQMELVRQELDRVHDLTRQLHTLQAELAKQPAADKDPEVQRLLSETQATAGSSSVDPARAFNPDGWNEAFREAAQKVMTANVDLEARPAPNEQRMEPAFASSSESSLSDSVKGKLQGEAREYSGPKEFGSSIEAPVIAEVPKGSSHPFPPAAMDIHALLCQKIATLQAERQSRWQKILGFLAGKQSGEAMP